MENNTIVFIAIAIVGAVIGYVIKNFLIQNEIKKEEIEAGKIINDAKKDMTNRICRCQWRSWIIICNN